MKILAIRGRNLASLAGDFEIPLESAPLAGAGLFAIVGRTGAGKSTVLDALCLALFDRMPRLIGAQSAAVGRAEEAPESRVRADDVRSILRRGAGEGHAETDFRGVDRRRYRARWTVRRARGKADGRFQAQTMELRDLETGALLGATKTEVLELIQQRLGLSFDQFRRSVLLAQGDFAAFLRAPARERAELLERITGTGIYSDLSRAAHRRAAEERRALDLLVQRLGDQRPLDDESRAALETELAESRTALESATKTQEALKLAESWYAARDRLQAELDAATQGLVEAERLSAEAQPRRVAWQRVRELEALRLPLAERDKTAAALVSAEQALEAGRATERQRTTAAEEADGEAKCAASAHAEAQAKQQALAPALQSARELDSRIRAARELHDGLAQECETARATLAETGAAADALRAQSESTAGALAAAEQWLAEHLDLSPLAEQWPAWERELGRSAQARRALDAAETVIRKQSKAESELTVRRQTHTAAIADLTAAQTAASEERAELEARGAGLDPAALAARREARQARERQVAGWRDAAQRMAELRARLAQSEGQLAEERSRAARAQARHTEIAAELLPLDAARVEAEETLDRLRLANAETPEKLRAQLKEGRPCPVCGAESHPWAGRDGALLHGLLSEQTERVKMLRERHRALSAEQAEQGARAAESERRVGALTAELVRDGALLAERMQDWAAQPPDPLRPDDPGREGLDAELEQELATAAADLASIARDESESRAFAESIKSKTVEIERLASRLEHERAGLVSIDTEQRERAELRRQAEAERERAVATLAETSDLLAAPLAPIPDWQARLAADPEGLAVLCRERAQDWQRMRAERDRAAQAQFDLAPKLAELGTRREAAAADLDKRTGTLAEQSEALAALERERAALLDGRPADAVESELAAALGETGARLERARAALASAREALTEAQGAAAAQATVLDECRRAAEVARDALEAQLAERGATLEELRASLASGPDWIETERAALQALSDGRERARALAAERERRLAEHSATAAPAEPRESVRDGLEHAAESLKTAQDHWGALHGRLAEDERRRGVSREIAAEHERQQAVWTLWESLRELIGSADGAKLRGFAQGLTLDLLVAQANLHLQDLARRYALERVPGSEMELQVVDREMGDEVRGIHSLSGGESFLASLALALGLASLASDRVQVESLFIDEGFGALDSDSLDIAIATLDALYSQGRQVGVISHVTALVERIGVRVEVRKEGGGRSGVAIVGI